MQKRIRVGAWLFGGMIAVSTMGFAAPALAADPPAPANDSIDFPEDVQLLQNPSDSGVIGQSKDFDFTGATTTTYESNPTCAQGDITGSLWYTVVPTNDVIVTAQAYVPDTQTDPTGGYVLDVFSGSEEALKQVGCNSQPALISPTQPSSQGYGPTLTGLHLKGDTEYWIRVSNTENQPGTGTLVISGVNGQPVLTQTNSNGKISLRVQTSPDYRGQPVYFYQRSGVDGKVTPQGYATVGAVGAAGRVIQKRRGQTLAIYAKVVGVHGISTPYSNTITFRTS